MNERENIEKAIAAQESLRPTLGDAVVDSVIAALREKLGEGVSGAQAEQRKQVTVLFGDVSGFTAMAETMDAEELRDAMNDLWARLDGALTRHGGFIDKHIGDAVMALFGVPLAQEDDPERAVKAALAMQAEIAEFVAKTGKPLKMRIGVNTGPFGTVGSTKEFTAMGDAVNLASRLEAAAPAGGVLISNDVYRHVRDRFYFQKLEADPPEGQKELVQAYVVQRVKPQGSRLTPRSEIETPMIGRDAEFQTLRDALSQSLEERESTIATVVGEAGLGKSRLLFEFQKWARQLPEAPVFLTARAFGQTASSPYGLLRNLFAARFGIMENDDIDAVRAKMERGVRGMLGHDQNADRKAHFIGQMIGYDFSGSAHLKGALADPQQMRDRALVFLGDLFAAAATSTPTLFLLEDIHWADELSLEAVARVAAAHPKLPLFVVCLARPTLYERLPWWGEGHSGHQRIDLKPLSKADSRRLVAEILRKAGEVPARLRDLIVDNSEGNPFYVEELINMLTEEGVVVKDGQRWRIEAARLVGLKVPPTLTGVLQSRLDSLPPAEKDALQRASVVGRVFWDDAVENLRPQALVRDVFEDIRRKEMVFRREPSAFSGAREYTFKHALLRDVAYESVLKRARVKLHAQAADWLVSKGGARAGEFAGLIADHYEQGGQPDKAVDYLEVAGSRALRISAYREAILFFDRALALLSGTKVRQTEKQIVLTRELGDAHVGMSDYARARACFESSLSLARKSDDGKAMVWAINNLSMVAWGVDDYELARARAEEAMALAEKIGDPIGLAASLYHSSRSALLRAQPDEARNAARRSLALFENLSDEMGISLCFNHLGLIAHDVKDYQESRTYYERSLALAKKIGNPREAGRALSNMGMSVFKLGDRAEARRLYQEALATFREVDFKRGLAACLDNLGELESADGNLAAARSCYCESVKISKGIGRFTTVLAALAGLAEIQAKSGEKELALEMLSLVLHHPISDAFAKERAKLSADRLEAELPKHSAAAAINRGKTLRLDAEIEKLLSGL